MQRYDYVKHYHKFLGKQSLALLKKGMGGRKTAEVRRGHKMESFILNVTSLCRPFSESTETFMHLSNVTKFALQSELNWKLY